MASEANERRRLRMYALIVTAIIFGLVVGIFAIAAWVTQPTC